MEKISFNLDWQVSELRDEKTFINITLPHDAMISEKRTLDSLGGKNIGWFEAKDYVYKKTFYVPEHYKDKHVVFEFEGVYQHAEVFINGNKIAVMPSGYINFYVEANPYLKYNGQNEMLVYAYNSNQPNSRWYSGTGIYRPVNMFLLPKKHIEINGLKIQTINHEAKTIAVMIKSNDQGTMIIDILDDKKIIASKTVETTGEVSLIVELPDAQLWDVKYPKLYTCRVTFDQDIQEVKFGIRTVSVNANTGLLINGKHTILYGACVHHDNGILGAAAHPHAEYRKIKLLKEAGYNAIRSAHNPCSKDLLDACDELGMFVVDEYVDMWYIHKTKYDYASHVEKRWKRDLKDIVDKDFNHPSVIMYSTGNEVSETAQDKGIAFTKEMTDYLHELDNRPVTCGINIFFNYLSKLGFGVYTDKKAEENAKQKHNNKAVGSEFFNNLAGLMGDKFMKWGATLSGSDKNTKKAFANMDVAGYNYGVRRYKKDLKKYPNRVILGTETFSKDACYFYDLVQDNPALIGDFVWTGMDYLGEVGLGAWVYEHQAPDFNYGPNWIAAGSGRLDLLGNSNGETAYTKVAFNQEVIRMAVVPVYRKKIKRTPAAWRMSNAIESWSFNGMNGSKAHVEVYAKAHYVELLLNGKRIAKSKKKKNGCTFFIQTKYYPGTLTAVGFDHKGNELGRTSLVTAGEDTTLNVYAEKSVDQVKEQLIFTHLKLTDNEGIVKPLEQTEITIQMKKGSLLGFGNGCAYNKYGFTGNVNVTYFGEAMAIFKPDEKGLVEAEINSIFGKETYKQSL